MRVLITGGAGFVGSNLVRYFMKRGYDVSIIDNLSRPKGGSIKNLSKLKNDYSDLAYHIVDVSSMNGLRGVFSQQSPHVVVHCAAQTSLRRYLSMPYEDFTSNALGTLNVLKMCEEYDSHMVFLSTNKVYGLLNNLPMDESKYRYDFYGIEGINEKQQLDPHSDPYSLSKYIADRYCQLYKKTTVLRMSSIYGQGQWSIAGQGWIGVFALHTLQGKGIEVSGDGRQVRDILHIDDLVKLIDAIIDMKITGVFNVGGGKTHSLSIRELLQIFRDLGYTTPQVKYKEWNPWTQKVYVTDYTKIREVTGWKPHIGTAGIEPYIKQWLLSEVLPQGYTL